MKTYWILILSILAGCASSPRKLASDDSYESFAPLAKENKEGVDYAILSRYTGQSDALVMAIHGGKIEVGTTELAKDVAKKDLGLYSFQGLKDDSHRLHITATHFDEPKLMDLLPQAERCLSLHGLGEDGVDFCVGGADVEGRKSYVAALTKAFPTAKSCELCCGPNAGVSPDNVANRCGETGDEPGVQIEMSPSIRMKMLKDPSFRKKVAKVMRNTLLAD